MDEESYGALIIKNDEFLSAQSPDGYWGVPKGHLNEGEEPLDCALRECFEEIGLKEIDYISDKIFFEKYFNEKWKVYKKVGLFIIKTTQTKFLKTSEISKIEFLDEKEFIARMKNCNYFNAIKDALDYYKANKK